MLQFDERLQPIEITPITIEPTIDGRTTRGVKNHAKYADLMPKKQRMEAAKEMQEANDSSTLIEPDVQI
jgi:hypothetical protein